MRKKTAACLLLFVFVLMPSYAYAGCESPENLNRGYRSAFCLAIKTCSPTGGSMKTLVVVLHGDLSRGGDIENPIEGACPLW